MNPDCKHKEAYKGKDGKRECGACGAVCIRRRWKRICQECKSVVAELFGLFVPHLCKTCAQAKMKQQRAEGKVCRLCGNVYLYCCC